MDAARTEPDETTRLLTNQTDEVRGSDDGSSPAPRQRLLQKQILLLALVLVLLQFHLIFFNVASREAKLRQICYKFDKEHNHGHFGPDGNMVDWVHCYLEEPVMQQFRELLNWEKGISIIVCEFHVHPVPFRYMKSESFSSAPCRYSVWKGCRLSWQEKGYHAGLGRTIIVMPLDSRRRSVNSWPFIWVSIDILSDCDAPVSFPGIFPLRLVWAGPAFWLVGGGTSLSITLIYLLASESLHEEQR